MLRDEVKHNDVRFSLETDWRAHPFSIYHCILFTPRYMQTKHAYIYVHTHTYTQVNKAHSHTSRKAEPTWPSMAKSVPLSKSYKCILWTTHLTLIKDRPLTAASHSAHTSVTPKCLPQMSRIVLLILTLPNISWMDLVLRVVTQGMIHTSKGMWICRCWFPW